MKTLAASLLLFPTLALGQCPKPQPGTGGPNVPINPQPAYNAVVAGTVPLPPVVWRAEDLVHSIGVVTHIGYNGGYSNKAGVAAAFNMTGIRLDREALPDLPLGDPRLQNYYGLMSQGAQFSLTTSACCGTGPTPGTQLLQADQINLDDFEMRYPGHIVAVEGLNEPDLQNDGYTYNFNCYSGALAVGEQQQALYAMVKADPLLKGIPVWEYSLNSPPYNQGMYEQVITADPAVVGAMDYLNRGVYPGYFSPEWGYKSTIYNAHDVGFNGSYFDGPYQPMMVGKPVINKETGVLSSPTGNKALGLADYTVQAKTEPNLWLDGMLLGAKDVIIYELVDEVADPNFTNLQYHWGLFDASLTAKPVVGVISRMLAELRDAGPNNRGFKVAPITVSVPQFPLFPPGTADTGTGFDLVTETTGGAYKIVVWYEPEAWNAATGQEYPPPAPVAVTVNLSVSCAATNIVDPYAGTTTPGPANVSSIPVALPDHAVIVECLPAG